MRAGSGIALPPRHIAKEGAAATPPSHNGHSTRVELLLLRHVEPAGMYARPQDYYFLVLDIYRPQLCADVGLVIPSSQEAVKRAAEEAEAAAAAAAAKGKKVPTRSHTQNNTH